MAEFISATRIKASGNLHSQWQTESVTPHTNVEIAETWVIDTNLSQNNSPWGSKGLCAVKLIDGKGKVFDQIKIPMQKRASLGHPWIRMFLTFNDQWATRMWAGSPEYQHFWRIQKDDPQFQPGKLVCEFFGKIEDIGVAHNYKSGASVVRYYREGFDYVNTSNNPLGPGAGACIIESLFKA